MEKCPKWEDKICALVASNENYWHFTYREMEQEITQRDILRAGWEMLSAKAQSIVQRVQKRADKLCEATSFPGIGASYFRENNEAQLGWI